MAGNQEAGSTPGRANLRTRRIRCWKCSKVSRMHVDMTCPACGIYNQVRPKESLGYQILMWILWLDVAITLGTVVLVAESCG